MGFPRGPRRAPEPARVRTAVFAVGWRVYVACPGDRFARVTLTDETDKKSVATLGDGSEVTIVAWRPAPSGGTRYRVRATDSPLEGWLPVCNLRGTKQAVSGAPTVSPPSISPSPLHVEASGAAGHKFGQRR